MKKIPAYSFIELMIVMIIGTITIAIAYQGYILFYRQYVGFKNSAEKNSTIVCLDALLVNDFNSSKEIRKTNDGIICISKNKNIRYSWADNYIIRTQSSSIDTFSMAIQELTFSLNSIESKEGELVNELYFLGNDNLHFQIVKKYGADILINSELKNN